MGRVQTADVSFPPSFARARETSRYEAGTGIRLRQLPANVTDVNNTRCSTFDCQACLFSLSPTSEVLHVLLVYLVFRQQTIGCFFFCFFVCFVFKIGFLRREAPAWASQVLVSLSVFTHAPDHSLDRSHPCSSPRRAVFQSDVLYEWRSSQL